MTSAQEQGTFVPSEVFSGARPGYAFKAGTKGLGYYRDPHAREAKMSNDTVKAKELAAAAVAMEGRKEEKEEEGVLVPTRFPGQFIRVISNSLIEACKMNDVKAVIRFLAEEDRKPENEPGAADKDGHTGLHWAALKNHEKIVTLLLQADKSIVNASNSRGETPIHWAVIKGNLKMVSLLLRNGADPSACDRNGYNVLHKAAQYKLTLVIDFFYRLGEDLKAREDSDEIGGATERCVLHFSARRGGFLLTNHPHYLHSSRIGMITGKIPAIDSQDAHGRTALHWACYKGDNFTAQYLIRKGSDFTVRDDELCTPLHWAAIKGQKNIVVILLRLGAEEHLSMKDKFGLTPLESAQKKVEDMKVEQGKLQSMMNDLEEVEPTKEGVHYAVKHKLKYNEECERLAKLDPENMENEVELKVEKENSDEEVEQVEMKTPEQAKEEQILATVRQMHAARKQMLGKKLSDIMKEGQNYRKMIKHIKSVDGFWGWRRALGIVRYLENVRFYCFFSWWGANLLLQGIV